jgi:molybdate transport system substrate-binding protein
VVFAAASLRDVAVDLAAEYRRQTDINVVFNFAGSNTLAQQIGAAPRADIFLSADREWVNVLQETGRTVPQSERRFLGNHLVLIAHREARISITDPRELAEVEYRFLAIADPLGVPAGRYARASLERLRSADLGNDLWSLVESRIVPASNVRAALALVESDPEILGIVYGTDAAASKVVKVLYEFPVEAGPPITYWAVLVDGSKKLGEAQVFVDFLTTSSAQEIGGRRGFRVVNP